MVYCSFSSCPSHKQKARIPGVIYHSFPSNIFLRQQWIEIVRKERREPEWVPTIYSRVCTLHFNPGQVFKTTRGDKRVLKGALPYIASRDDIEDESRLSPKQDTTAVDTNETDVQNDITTYEAHGSEELAVDSEMDGIQVEVSVDNASNYLPQNMAASELSDEPKSDEKPKESNPIPLDKFKRRLIRAVARHINEKKPEEDMWTDLKKEIGCDCQMLWHHMRALTLKKLKRLLPANDLLANLKKIARFTATDWLLFDLILVHEKVNVISINDGENEDDEIKEEPQCLHDLFELIIEHNVERLSGDDLTEAWIRVTLQYNSRGRQCSPMLLQLRWHQLKELTRARFYNFWYAYRGNNKLLDEAMKWKPTMLQTEIAKHYKDIVTQTYPEWEKLIEERRVILSEEFTLHRLAQRKAEKSREENDVEIELIEPHVETIELEDIDSDEEDKTKDTKADVENSSHVDIQDNNKESFPVSDDDEDQVHLENNINSESVHKSESDDDNTSVLDLDGLSVLESMHIPSENTDEKQSSEKISEKSTEEISETNEILPKITNVVGNIVEPTESTDQTEQEINTATENDYDRVDEIIPETTLDDNRCTETKDVETIRCDSDNEIDETLQEKSDSLMNIEITQIKSECDPENDMNTGQKNIETFQEMQEEVDDDQEEEMVDSVNNPSCSDNKSSACDSDDDIDTILQEKANDYLSSTTSQANAVAKESLEDPNLCQEIIDDDLYVNNEIDDNDTVEGVKKEKHDDGFDEIDIDDDLIEFVDDGIEFVEEKEEDKKTDDVKKESLSESEDESAADSDDCPKIDLKLLMNPTVYTKKLDVMDIFKCTNFNSVSDKNVIERALIESKPVDKMAVKDEDMNKFREQSIHGYDTDGNQSDSDIVQTTVEETCNRVKCTSWLLQKPKNRNYNPIQLCKNPDFNTRLKRLTAGFLSSTRNRVFLKECKPLTIDLHKAFEKKLIDGTLYLKRGDFKSAKSINLDKINDNPVSVLPSMIPGQSMIFTNTTEIPNKLGNQEYNTPSSSFVDKNICIERRKTINLPDIDQVRRFNQSLLTAEVTPIRIENKIDNTNSSEETVKTSISQEPTFVKPIVLEPFAQIKQEPLELNVDDKSNLQLQQDQPQYEITSRKDLMTNKINDQIINLSNQISAVDNNEVNKLVTIDVEKLVQKQSHITKKLAKKAKKAEMAKAQHINKLTYIPRYRGKLTWLPKYPKNHIVDSLLTLDTLSKILFILNGDEEEISHCSCKQKKYLKEIHVQQTQSQIKDSKNDQGTNVVQSELMKCDEELKSTSTNNVCQAINKKKPRKPRSKPEPKKYSGIYCCWAREKMINITKNKEGDPVKHGCVVYHCQCCCREELVTLTTWRNSKYQIGNIPISKRKKKVSTIVLSDDDDVSKDAENDNRSATMPDTALAHNPVDERIIVNPSTSNLLTEQSDKVALEIVIPPLTCIGSNTTNVIVKDVAIQSEMPPNMLFNVKNITTTTVHEPSDKEKEDNMLIKPKICKTIVRSADGHSYNKRVEPNSSITHSYSNPVRNIEKETRKPIDATYNFSNPIKNIEIENPKSIEPIFNVYNSIRTIEKQTPKPFERTLYLNSNQIGNKPLRSPIYLGRNKILLCSLKNSKVTAAQINPSVPVVPYGVNFLVSNGEITLSVENDGSHSEQLSTMPAPVPVVQEQCLKSDTTNNTSIPDHNISQGNDDVKIIEENISPKEILTNTTQYKENNPIVVENKSVESNNLIDNDKNILTETSSSDMNDGAETLPVNNENGSSGKEVINAEIECPKSIEEQQVTESQTKNSLTESLPAVENRENISETHESSVSSVERCSNDNNDASENNNNANTRKTILSDLMEMSGISAEDTNMVPEATDPPTNIITLPPNIIPVTKVTSSGVDAFNMHDSNNVLQGLTITGPYSNLFSFEPITPLNRLLNSVGHFRPELNAVTSFAELKYVYVNGGKFYKLDVDSGVIAEIKVFIKKNPQSMIDKTPKAFIDLTDDAGDSENVTAEFQDIPQDKQENTVVKPIKLFKSLHPSILNRSRSLLRETEIVYPKKVIRVSKQKRKQLLHLGNRYLLVDVDNEQAKPEAPPVSQLDSSYDSSDEEPLAKKCKRKQLAEKKEEDTIPLFEDVPETCNPPSVPEEVVGNTEVDMNFNVDNEFTSDVEMNSMDIEGVNPELHPVAFEEGSESEEDMCILGV